MIRLTTPAAHLRPNERYGLAVLLDASRLLPVDDPAADVVRLTITNDRRDDYDAFLAGRWALTHEDGEVRFSRNVLSYVSDVAGAGEEQRSESYDPHDRVPSHENPLVRAERWREPVVSRHAAALRAAVRTAAGPRPVRCLAPWPNGRRWAAAFTHDLDVVAGWPVFTLLRLVELLRRGEVGRAARSTWAGLAAAGRRAGGGQSPVWQGVDQLLRADGDAGVRSTWFVIGGTPTLRTWAGGDVTYRPESRATRRLLSAVSDGGHEIGLHGSFASWLDVATLRRERERLAAVTGRVPGGVRQHFLRMRPGATQQAMLAAGFRYDATYGYPDRSGFRLGVADIVPGWDANTQASTPLDEVPLVWMDRALSKYGGVEDPDAWIEDGVSLAAACREVEGLWVGLWHPNLTPALGFPDAPAGFGRLVREVLAGERPPFVGTLGEVVAWRAARRGVRARTVTSEGRLDLVADGEERQQWPLVLEDGQGRVVETRPWPAGDHG